MNTLDELEKLLAAATPGPWKIERGKRCIQGPDTRDGDPLVLTSMMGGATKWSHSPYSEYCVPKMKEGDANAALIVAAVNALPELVERVKELRTALGEMVEAFDEHILLPEGGCSCHGNHPCNYCPDYSFALHARESARAALNQETDP